MSAACCSRAERQNEKRQSRIRRRLLLFLQLATLARSHALRPFSSLSHQSSRRHFSFALGTNKESALALTGTCRSARGSHAGSARSCRARTGPASPRRRTRPRLPSKYLQCVRRSPWLLKLFGKREEECASERKAACVNAAKGEGGEEKKREELRWSCVQSIALQSLFFFVLFFDFSSSLSLTLSAPVEIHELGPPLSPCLSLSLSLSLARSLALSLPPSQPLLSIAPPGRGIGIKGNKKAAFDTMPAAATKPCARVRVVASASAASAASSIPPRRRAAGPSRPAPSIVPLRRRGKTQAAALNGVSSNASSTAAPSIGSSARQQNGAANDASALLPDAFALLGLNRAAARASVIQAYDEAAQNEIEQGFSKVRERE